MNINQNTAWEKYISENWFLNFLMITTRKWSVSLGIPIAFLVFAIIIISVCKLEGTWILSGDPVGLKEDHFMLALYFVLAFMGFGIVRALNRLDAFLESLQDMVSPNARPSVHDKAEWIKECVTAKNKKSKRFKTVLMVFMLCLFLYMQVIVPFLGFGEGEESWAMMPKVHSLSYSVAFFWTLFWLSLLANFIWYCLSMAFATWWALRDYSNDGHLVVIPLAPDGKGGLSSIGDVSYAISISASSGVIGLIIWMNLFGTDLYFWIGAAGYAIVLLTLFFIPLMAVHGAMATARKNELHRLSDLFMDGYSKLKEYGDREGRSKFVSDPQIEESAGYLGNLDQLYSRAEAMPVWPFEAILLVRLIMVVVLPFVFGVLEGALGDPLLELLKKVF